MNLLQLQYFYVVAKEGGFTNASKVLRIQQPAISRMVKQLEDFLGFPLFERVGRQVQLTAQGREVFERSQRIFENVESLQSAVGQLVGVAKGPLAFGGAEPIISHFVPDILERLLPDYPELYPIIHSGPASVLFDQIRKGQLEFGLFFHIPSLPSDLKMRTLRKVRFHLVVRKDLRKNKNILESFIGSREVDDTASRTFPTLEKLKKTHPQATIKISSNNLTAHLSFAQKGLGVAVLPDFLVKQHLEEGQLADLLSKEKLEFDLKLVQRANAVAGLNAQTFFKYCSS